MCLLKWKRNKKTKKLNKELDEILARLQESRTVYIRNNCTIIAVKPTNTTKYCLQFLLPNGKKYWFKLFDICSILIIDSSNIFDGKMHVLAFLTSELKKKKYHY